MKPKSSAQQVKTPPTIVELVDKLLDDHIYSEIADILNQRGTSSRRIGATRSSGARFTALRVAYLTHPYALRSRYDRLRQRGMLTKGKPLLASAFTNRRLSAGRNVASSKARLQCPRVPLRASDRTYRPNIAADGTDSRRSSSRLENGEGIKTFRSNRRRCSVKPVTCAHTHSPLPSQNEKFQPIAPRIQNKKIWPLSGYCNRSRTILINPLNPLRMSVVPGAR